MNRLLGDQETLIGAILLGNNVVNILASALTTAVLSQAIPGPQMSPGRRITVDGSLLRLRFR